MRRRLQGVLPLRLGERLAVQRLCIVGIRLHGGKPGRGRSTLEPGAASALPPAGRTISRSRVARDVVTCGGEEDAVARRGRRPLRCEPERPSASSAAVARRRRGLGRIVPPPRESRRPCRRARSSASARCRARSCANDRREPRMQRHRYGCLRLRPRSRAAEGCPRRCASVALQDLRIERLGQRRLALIAEHGLDDVDGRLAERGHDTRHLDRRAAPPIRSLAVHRRGDWQGRLERARCPRRRSASASSSAKSGFPPDVSESLTSVGRGKLTSRRIRSSSCRAPMLRPSSSTVASLGSARLRWSEEGGSPRTVRRVAIGSSSRRDSAKRTAVSDASSSHWTSSTARQRSSSAARSRKAARNAVATVAFVDLEVSGLADQQRRIERASLDRRQLGKDGVGDGAEEVRQPGVGEGVSDSNARQDNVL